MGDRLPAHKGLEGMRSTCLCDRDSRITLPDPEGGN
jgi:hypothetical protein